MINLRVSSECKRIGEYMITFTKMDGGTINLPSRVIFKKPENDKMYYDYDKIKDKLESVINIYKNDNSYDFKLCILLKEEELKDMDNLINDVKRIIEKQNDDYIKTNIVKERLIGKTFDLAIGKI